MSRREPPSVAILSVRHGTRVVEWAAGRPSKTSSCLVHDPEAEERAGKRIERRVTKWENRVVALHDRGHVNVLVGFPDKQPRITIQGDPRGRVLLLQLPGESEPVGV